MSKRKYKKEEIEEALAQIDKYKNIRCISKKLDIPETTIRNWKFFIYNTNNKLEDSIKSKVLILFKEGYSIPEIAENLGINYNKLRIYLKKSLSQKEYCCNKLINKKLKDSAKSLTPELAYILGVMFGDGYTGKNELRLGAKDKEFVEYFIKIVNKWCNKEPLRYQRIQHNNPYYECYLCFKDATDFVISLLKDKQNIPDIIIDSNNKDVITMFVKGFSDSEGTIVGNGKGNWLKISNQKVKILNQLKELMVKLGFNNNKLHVVFNNKAKNGDVYVLQMCYLDQIKHFYKTIGFTIQRKQIKLEKIIKGNI